MALTPEQLDHYQSAGYLVVRGVFSPARIGVLRDGIEALIDRVLAGKCEINWIDRDQRLPARTGHLLHPDKYHPAFAQWLDEDLAPLLEALVEPPLRHSLFGMLAGGGGQAYAQHWHRDIARPGAADEADYLQRHDGHSVQFNAPLQPGDRFLHIVPGSHTRASTTAELAAAQTDPPGSVDMPGALVVEMEPGDIAVYNANLWHRGWNPEGCLRWTMHSAFWQAGYGVMQHEWGQREALEHEEHLGQLPPVTRQYVQRYLAVYPEADPPSLFDI
ncbi:MAG: hypothetical protein GKR89_06805 [Candidatus Latescibacteria bacterium]|nr:hypothetical protein [Candidatus Latescibacterota bacterium]